MKDGLLDREVPFLATSSVCACSKGWVSRSWLTRLAAPLNAFAITSPAHAVPSR